MCMAAVVVDQAELELGWQAQMPETCNWNITVMVSGAWLLFGSMVKCGLQVGMGHLRQQWGCAGVA